MIPAMDLDGGDDALAALLVDLRSELHAGPAPKVDDRLATVLHRGLGCPPEEAMATRQGRGAVGGERASTSRWGRARATLGMALAGGLVLGTGAAGALPGPVQAAFDRASVVVGVGEEDPDAAGAPPPAPADPAPVGAPPPSPVGTIPAAPSPTPAGPHQPTGSETGRAVASSGIEVAPVPEDNRTESGSRAPGSPVPPANEFRSGQELPLRGRGRSVAPPSLSSGDDVAGGRGLPEELPAQDLGRHPSGLPSTPPAPGGVDHRQAGKPTPHRG